MSDRIHIVYNAADAIEHFRESELVYPNFGEHVAASEILHVIESRYRRLYALIGFTTTHDEVLLKVTDIKGAKITVDDKLGTLTEEWVCRIANDPSPCVTASHGDLLFDLLRVESS